MVLSRILIRKVVALDSAGLDKWTAIERLVDALVQSGKVLDRGAILDAVFARERQGSTGIDNSIAIPHARTPYVTDLAAALGVSRNGIDFDSADGKPCHLVFLVAAPPEDSNRYLCALAELASFGSDPEAVAAMKTVRAPEDAIRILHGFCGRPVT